MAKLTDKEMEALNREREQRDRELRQRFLTTRGQSGPVFVGRQFPRSKPRGGR